MNETIRTDNAEIAGKEPSRLSLTPKVVPAGVVLYRSDSNSAAGGAVQQANYHGREMIKPYHPNTWDRGHPLCE